MVDKNKIKKGLRVVLNSNFVEKCLGDKYLRDEKIIWCDDSVMNDSKGDYVYLRCGSLINSGYAYLNEIDVVENCDTFIVPEHPIYFLYQSGGNFNDYQPTNYGLSLLNSRVLELKKQILDTIGDKTSYINSGIDDILDSIYNRQVQQKVLGDMTIKDL